MGGLSVSFICVWCGKSYCCWRCKLTICFICCIKYVTFLFLKCFWKWFICTGNSELPKLSMPPTISNLFFNCFCWTFHESLCHIFLFAAGGFPVCHHATSLSHWESFQGAKPQISHWRTWSFYKGIPLGICAWTRSLVFPFRAATNRVTSVHVELTGTSVSCCQELSSPSLKMNLDFFSCDSAVAVIFPFVISFILSCSPLSHCCIEADPFKGFI